MAKQCINCGAQLSDTAKFCGGCGAQQVQQQPAQQAQPPQYQQPPQQAQPPQYQQPAPAPAAQPQAPPFQKKKKSKAPLIAVICVVCVCVGGLLVWTKFFAGKSIEQVLTGSGNSVQTEGGGQAGSDIYKPNTDANMNSDDIVFIPVKDGDRELFLEWLQDLLDADEYDEAVNGRYAVLPFDVTDSEGDRLEGYAIPTDNGEGEGDSPTDTDYGVTQSKGWPADKLPSGMPVYPDGEVKVTAISGMVSLSISGTSKAGFDSYKAALKDAGWNVSEMMPEYFQAEKDGCSCICTQDKSDVTIVVMGGR